jgi:hypothetical protein
MRLNVPSLIDGHPDFDVLMPSFSGGVNIEWMGEDRVFYDVQYSEALINPSVWYDLCTQIKGTNGTMSCIDTNMGSGIRFYRIIGY